MLYILCLLRRLSVSLFYQHQSICLIQQLLYASQCKAHLILCQCSHTDRLFSLRHRVIAYGRLQTHHGFHPEIYSCTLTQQPENTRVHCGNTRSAFWIAPRTRDADQFSAPNLTASCTKAAELCCRFQ